MDPSMNNSFGGNGERPIISSMNEGQAMQAPGGQMPNMQPPVVSSGGGDIYLSSSKTNSDKKKWFFVIALAVLSLLTVGVVVVLMLGGQKGGNTTTTAADYRESFNQYANYLLSGEASNEQVTPEYKKYNFYAIEGAV